MAVSKPAIAGTVTGVTALAGGTYAALKSSSPTFWDKVKEDAISREEKNDNKWTSLVNKVAQKESNFFNEITDKVAHLKKWCFEKYDESIGEELTNEQQTILEQIKNRCIYTLRMHLGDRALNAEVSTENVKIDDEEQIYLPARVRNLKEHKDNQLTLTDYLLKIKKNTDDLPTNIGKLKGWCKSNYGKGFKNEEDNLWKLVNKFCSVPTIKEMFEEITLKTEEEFKDDWKGKVKKTDNTATQAKEEELKKELEKAGSEEDKKIKALQDWCEKQKNKLANEEVYEEGGIKHYLYYEFIKFCTLTIGEKIGNNKQLDVVSINDTGKSEWQAKETALKGELNGPTLTSELEEIKKGNDNDNWKKLRSWCKETYLLGYKGANDNLWKLADKFCKN